MLDILNRRNDYKFLILKINFPTFNVNKTLIFYARFGELLNKIK